MSTKRFCIAIAATVVAAGTAFATGHARAQSIENDFPTEARADYVFACMSANGQTQDMLRRCSCSIDVIASIMPYEDYVRAETILGVIQAGGERVAALRSPSQNLIVANLRRAQAEAEVRCF
jgi:hypothetical protein